MYGTPGPDSFSAAGTNRPTDDERTWAAIAHAGSFVAAWVALGILAPLAVLLLRGNTSPFVRQNAIESINFQLNALFWIAVCVLLSIVLIGLALLVVVGIWYVVFVVLATVRASTGRAYRYPLIVRIAH